VIKISIPGPYTASYIVFKDRGVTYAKNGMTGKVEFSSTDDTQVIQYAINNSPPYGVIYLTGDFEIKGEIVLNRGKSLIGNNANLIAQEGFQGDAVIKIIESPVYPSNRRQEIYGLYINASRYAKYGIYTPADNCVGRYHIARNVIVSLNQAAIRIENCGVYTIYSNFILTSKDGIVGIDINGGGDNLIAFNDISGGAWGIRTIYSANDIIIGNNIYMQYTNPNLNSGRIISGFGIQVHGNVGSTRIIGNRIDISPMGIAVTDSRDVVIEGNTFIKIGINWYTDQNPDPNAYTVINVSGENMTAIINSNTITFELNRYNTARRALYSGGIRRLILTNFHISSIGDDSWPDIRVIELYVTQPAEVVIDKVYYHEPRSLTKPVYGIMLNGTTTIRAIIGDHNLPNLNINYSIVRFYRNKGVANIPAGQTRVTVNHYLVSAPTRVLITPYGNARVWVENITSTSFDIVTDTAPTSDLTVAWYAEV